MVFVGASQKMKVRCIGVSRNNSGTVSRTLQGDPPGSPAGPPPPTRFPPARDTLTRSVAILAQVNVVRASGKRVSNAQPCPASGVPRRHAPRRPSIGPQGRLLPARGTSGLLLLLEAQRRRLGARFAPTRSSPRPAAAFGRHRHRHARRSRQLPRPRLGLRRPRSLRPRQRQKLRPRLRSRPGRWFARGLQALLPEAWNEPLWPGGRCTVLAQPRGVSLVLRPRSRGAHLGPARRSLSSTQAKCAAAGRARKCAVGSWHRRPGGKTSRNDGCRNMSGARASKCPGASNGLRISSCLFFTSSGIRTGLGRRSKCWEARGTATQ